MWGELYRASYEPGPPLTASLELTRRAGPLSPRGDIVLNWRAARPCPSLRHSRAKAT